MNSQGKRARWQHIYQRHWLSGFISIDCGAPNGNRDADLQINYVTDDGFIDSGVNNQVSSEQLPSSARTLRIFPNGTRNCYTIRPTSGGSSKYLIRASFLYGNYDGQSRSPTFDLYIGVNYWATVSFPAVDSYVHKEIIHVVPSTDRALIQVCLLNTGSGIPFISSLELRALNGNMYQTDATTVALYKRLNMGGNATFRHPQDVHDRLWSADDGSYSSMRSFGTVNIEPDPTLERRNDSYEVPMKVLETYATAPYSTGSLELNWQTFAADKWIVYFHFAEMTKLSPLREFTISTNDKILTRISLEYLTPVTIPFEQSTGGTSLNFEFVPNYQDLNYLPILNAVEVYYLLDLSRTSTALDDANAMNDIKTMYIVMKESWQGDPCVPSNLTWDGLKCSTDDPPRITSLDLSFSGLKGNIANSLANLTKLEYLNLSHNELTGSVPEFLAKLENLKVLDLTGNNLSGSVPKDLLARASDNTLQLSLAGNPNLENPSVENPNPKDPNLDFSGSWGLSKKTRNIIIIAAAFGLAVVVGGCIWIVHWKKQSAQRRISMESQNHSAQIRISMENQNGKSEPVSQGISGNIMRRYTFAEVESIIKNFDMQKVIGEGAFGKVFHGKLDDGTEVAVKKLSPSAKAGPRQFETEANLLSKIHHRHLVSLLGYCDEPENMALIYEYMPKGNLHENLSGKNGEVLTWDRRLCIAVDTAKGLDYLHNGCDTPIIHRDIKTANILLDEHLRAKISDFGLSRIFPSVNDILIATNPVGTRGYLDPEYYTSRSLTAKSDVYSFGVVLLELITARPVQGEEYIVEWAAQEVKKQGYQIQQIVDPRLDGQYDPDTAEKLVSISLSCVEKTVANRPDIHKVLADLRVCYDLNLERSQGVVNRATELSISYGNDVELSSLDVSSTTHCSTNASSYLRSMLRGFTSNFGGPELLLSLLPLALVLLTLLVA
ncbi:probable leucine-rich repeat receptor-like protein kinase At2g28990 isoform X2 [Punica granatum]|uniref:non-specific serine/threonine protein kinase n=1 Tax=Punica granatum TaxID=22663 RepID=A0A6P8CXF2_PUNGR|nr:probable leucine-rich repeat receptor-like protein kinase At2g28990 isoform X2 [Punica granatum]